MHLIDRSKKLAVIDGQLSVFRKLDNVIHAGDKLYRESWPTFEFYGLIPTKTTRRRAKAKIQLKPLQRIVIPYEPLISWCAYVDL